MRKVVNANTVAANAFLTTKQDVLEVEKIKKYVDKVREKTNYKTNVFIGGFDVTYFVNQCDFAFNMDKYNRNVYILSDMKDRDVLKGYFRRSLPKDFIKIMKETGKELLEEELEEKLSEIKPTEKEYVKVKKI